MNFLEHEMAVGAFVTSVVGGAAFANLALHWLTMTVEYFPVATRNFRYITFFQINKAACDRQKGQGVRGDKIFPNTQTDHHGTAGARQNQMLGIVPIQNDKTVGAVQLAYGFLYGR